MVSAWTGGQYGFFRQLLTKSPEPAGSGRAHLSRDYGWTGGQYSLFRILFGAYLFVHFSYLAFWAADIFSDNGMLPDATVSPLISLFPNPLAYFDSPAAVTGLSIAAAIASLFFAAGKWDRMAALFLWFVFACFIGRNPLIANPSMPYAGWMLLAHLFIPAAPYGSVAAKGRTDPVNGWAYPNAIFISAWAILALSYSYSGYTKLLSPSWVAGENVNYVLGNPLARDWLLRDIFMAVPPILISILTWFILAIELLFAPLALIRQLRPWLWAGMLFVQLGFAFLLNFPDLTIAMLLFHMFTFNPSWLKAKSMAGDIVHYDGTCALCHRVIRFLLSEDQERAIKFSPLQNGVLKQRIGDAAFAALGDTVIVERSSGEILVEAKAVAYLLIQMGGLWRLIGWVLNIIPTKISAWLYHFVGQRRFAWFGKKEDFCPIMPAELHARFITA